MSVVSIVIPTRNRAALLRQTIRSVLDQTWPEIEVIVVDEASEDNTQTVLKQFGSNIRVVRHENPKGASAARNVGVDRSSGEYVIFLDDDDLLHPRHVEELVRFAGELPSDRIATSGWRRFSVSENGVEVDSVVRPPETWKAPEAISTIFGHDPGCLVWGPSVIWPRDVFKTVEWDESLYGNEDIDLYARVLLSGYSFAGTDEGMAYYRSHQGRRWSSGGWSDRHIISGAKCRVKHANLLQEKSYRESVKPAIKESLMRILIKLQVHGGLSNWVSRVKDAYARWGGDVYYLPQPPRNSVKKSLLEGALSLGGTKAVGLLLRLQSRIGWLKSWECRASVENEEYESLMRQLTGTDTIPDV